jgi:hypothetical protein
LRLVAALCTFAVEKQPISSEEHCRAPGRRHSQMRPLWSSDSAKARPCFVSTIISRRTIHSPITGAYAARRLLDERNHRGEGFLNPAARISESALTAASEYQARV